MKPLTTYRILFCLFCLMFAHIATAQDSIPEGKHLIFDHDGQERTYLLHSSTESPEKLVIALHHFAENGRTMAIKTGLNAVADAHNYAIVYPDALGYYWDDGRIDAAVPPNDGSVADTGYILALRDDLLTQFGLTNDDVFLIGHENGGGLAYKLACDAPNQFEKIVVVSALMWEYHRDDCDVDTEDGSNLLIVYGVKDPLYLHLGNELQYLRTGLTINILSQQDTLEHWVDRYECDGNSLDAYSDANLLFVYDNCGDSSVAFLNIAEAGGQWVRQGYNINDIGLDYTDIIAAYLSEDTNWTGTATESNFADTQLPRDYTLYVPYSYDENTETSLVVHLHGRTANGNSQAHTSDFNRLAEENGLIAVYPDGINTEWNYGKDLPYLASPNDHDDEQFLRDVIADLQQDLAIDSSRIYATGLSNGGFFTQRLACTMQDTFAAFASVGATAPAGLRYLCSQEGVEPVPILYIHGTLDQLVGWNGYQETLANGQTIWLYEPMELTIIHWIEHNGCAPDFEAEQLAQTRPNETSTVIMRVNGCPQDTPVILYAVNGGGHVWHGVREYDVSYLGFESFDFNSSDVIWNFFKQFSLNDE